MSKMSLTKNSSPKPDYVGLIYYRHGLLCASYPKCVLLLTVIAMVWACIPLWSLPIYAGRYAVILSKIYI